MICTIPGCGRRRIARGYCHGHYNRWYRTGDTCADVPIGRFRRFGTGVTISDEVEWLAQSGETPERIAARLELTLQAAAKRLHRESRNDLARPFWRITARESAKSSQGHAKCPKQPKREAIP